jgi:hypothetical protein
LDPFVAAGAQGGVGDLMIEERQRDWGGCGYQVFDGREDRATRTRASRAYTSRI